MPKAFPEDRRKQLFGREPDVLYLVDRANQTGLTAVVAQPLMGKTWTLTEVARRLLEGREYFVGYHESKGGESQLLNAVADLYTRWLADSTMREQAVSLWDRHRHNLVPRIGQMVGKLFEKLAKTQVPEGVASVVSKAFDGLAKTQEDLLSGGRPIEPLPYDEALSLTELVAKVSKRRIVLILDSWEKSSISSEFANLEGFLKRREDWPDTHIFVAVRNTELDSTKINDEGYRRADDLCRITSAAKLYPLPPMRQKDAYEAHRITQFVQNTVPAAKDQSEQTILEMISGFPGVLGFWTDEANRTIMRTQKDLREIANNAQTLRYLKLEHLLSGLQDESRALAARLAFFPRLSNKTWLIFRDLLLRDQPLSIMEALVDDRVLDGEAAFPTYGHDTRHSAARQWFIKHKLPLIRRVSEQLVEAIASRITVPKGSDRAFFEVLVACSDIARQIGANPTTLCLMDAAQAAFGKLEAVSHPAFENQYRNIIQQHGSVVPLIAIALINRGIGKDQGGDRYGAIDDHNAAIALPNVSVELVAQALIFRGIAKNGLDDNKGAIDDYSAAIALPNAPTDRVAKALINRGGVKDDLGDSRGAIDDYSAVIELANALPDHVAQALIYRGSVKDFQLGDSDGANNDFSAAIGLPNTSVEWVAQIFVRCGVVNDLHLGDSFGAIYGYNAAIALPNPSINRMAALIYRGAVKNQLGDSNGAIDEYSSAIEMPNAPTNLVAKALFYRAEMKGQRGDSGGAIDDYSAAIALPCAPGEQVAQALIYRGFVKGQVGDSDGAIDDYSTAIAQPNASTEWVAQAFVRRGVEKDQLGDIKGAIADYGAAIMLPNAPDEWTAQAYVRRGAHKDELGDSKEAIADYDTAIKLPNAPDQWTAQAYVRRSEHKDQGGDSKGAIADYDAAIKLPNASAEWVAHAFVRRGAVKDRLGDRAGAIDDFSGAIVLPNAPVEQVAQAFISRSLVKSQLGNMDGALDDYNAAIKLLNTSA